MSLTAALTTRQTNILNGTGGLPSPMAGIAPGALVGDRLNELAKLALTTQGNGASGIGVWDTAGNFTATNVEDILAELYTAATTGGSDAITDAGGYFATDTVDGAFDALSVQIGGLTDTTYTFGTNEVLDNDEFIYPALGKLDARHLALQAQIGGDTAATKAYTEQNVVTDDEPVMTSLDALDIRAGITARDMGVIQTAQLILSAQPVATDTIDIGVDKYEFLSAAGSVAIDTNIAVLIGGSAAATRANLIAAISATDPDNLHDTLFLIDGVTPAVANGTEAYVADEVGNNVRIQSADVAGGTPQPSSASTVLAEAITDAADVWDVGNVNLNTLGGVVAGMHQEGRAAITVTAAMVTNGLKILFPFTIGGFIVQVRTAAGVLQGTTGTDTFVPTGANMLVTFGGGAAPDIQATDIISIQAWSAAA